jgi:hypothetical protein
VSVYNTDKMLTKKDPKSSIFYFCEKCDYKTGKKSQLDRHILTRKHKILTDTDVLDPKSSLSEYVCECGKLYKHRQSLFVHKKKCNFILDLELDTITSNKKENSNNSQDEKNYKNMFFKIMEENSEFKNLLINQQQQIMQQQRQIGELIPRVGNNNNNTIKQRFNINIFLNEQCKDALNMDDFVKSLDVSLKQLDTTTSKGLIEGLSNVFIENMNKLSVYQRPMHCTDIKRETLYIKDNNNWEKDIDKTKIKKAIKETSNKQFKTLQEWTEKNPDFKDNDTKKNYFVQALKSVSKDTKSIDEKVIKKICSNTYLKESLED